MNCFDNYLDYCLRNRRAPNQNNGLDRLCELSWYNRQKGKLKATGGKYEKDSVCLFCYCGNMANFNDVANPFGITEPGAIG